MDKEFLEKYSLFQNKQLLQFELILPQGFCNLNYKLTTSDGIYLVRKLQQNSLDRKLEFKTAYLAYKKKIAKKPLLLDKKNSLMICEFANGIHKSSFSFQDIKNLAKTLQKLHAIKLYKRPINLKKTLHSYKNVSFKTKILFKNLQNFSSDLVLCHQDLNPKNILFDKKSIFIIDFEYANINDRYFDLAALCVEFSLNQKEEKIFLNTYFSSKQPFDRKKLELYKKIYKALCSLWFKQLAV